MDEPCSALDPVATLKVEELIDELKERYTIVIVTHNMQQAARVANSTAFMLERRADRARADERDLHQPEGRADRALRDRQVRLAAGRAMQETRHQYRETLRELEKPGARRTRPRDPAARPRARVDQLPGRRARRDGRRRRRPDRRPLPRGPPGRAVDCSLASRRSPAICGSSPRCCTRSAASSGWATSASTSPSSCRCPATRRRRTRTSSTRSSGWVSSPARRSPRRRRRSPRATSSSPRISCARMPRSTGSTGRSSSGRSRSATTSTCASGAMFMILVARCLERVGDNTVDIAEQVVFVVTGLFREFADASTTPPRPRSRRRPGARRRGPSRLLEQPRARPPQQAVGPAASTAGPLRERRLTVGQRARRRCDNSARCGRVVRFCAGDHRNDTTRERRGPYGPRRLWPSRPTPPARRSATSCGTAGSASTCRRAGGRRRRG